MGYAKALLMLSLLHLLLLYGVMKNFFIVAAQPGFTSLVCGAPSDYFSQNDGIFWMSDAAYAPLISLNVSLAGHTLRSFPPDAISPSRRSCYSGLIPAGLSLVRATFNYQNYDALNSPPIFGVSIGATMYSTIDFKIQDPWVEEVILNATEVQAFCLIAISGTPVISLLELRPLPPGSYNHASSSSGVLLKKMYRLDCGSDANKITRFPDDNCDRIWDSDMYYLDPSTTSTHSILHLLNTSAVADAAPMTVLQSNRFNYHNLTLSYSLPLAKPTGKYLMNTYFGELYNSTGPSFKVSVNEAVLLTVNGWPPLSGVELTVTQAAGWWWNISLLPVTGSPQINGLELFETLQLMHPAYQGDARALNLIELGFNIQSVLLDWVLGSDPCFPVPWRGVICNVEGMITALDLSSSQLSGDVGGLFQDFTSLDILNASGNRLMGHIPDLKGRLQRLKFLDLSNNQLSGTLDAFADLNLHYLNVANNQFFGEIPKGLAHPGLELITVGNRCLFQNGTDPCAPVVSDKDTPHSVKKKPVRSSTHGSKPNVIGTGIGTAVAVITVAAAGILCCRRYKLRRELIDASEEAGTVNILEKELELDSTSKRYSLEELQNATNNFKEALGEGSLGPIYRGRLSDGTDVAIKLRSNSLHLTADSFLKEVSILSKLRHPNLVLLKGYCLVGKKQFLVFEFMSGGSLKDHLYGPLSKLQPMTWEQRLTSAIGAAAGLQYLHSGSDLKILHRNVKSSNILLGPNFVSKVADIGLFKPAVQVEKKLTRGTAGYLDPEYFDTSELTEKSDVFSFGVVLMEILCGREPLCSDGPPDSYNLVAWVRPALQEAIPKGETSVVDKALENQFVQQSLAIVANVALQCTEKEGASRPSMSEVVKELNRALDAEDLIPIIIEPSLPFKTLSPIQRNTNFMQKEFKIKPFHSQEFFPAQRSANVALQCQIEEGASRSSMSEVVKELNRASDAEGLIPTTIEPSLPLKTLSPIQRKTNITKKEIKIKPFQSQEIFPAQRSAHITYRAR